MNGRWILAATGLWLAACAPTTELPTVTTSEIEAEKQLQRKIAFGQALSDEQRLLAVASRVTRGGAGLCGLDRVRPRDTGATGTTDFSDEWGASREGGFSDDKSRALVTPGREIQAGGEDAAVEGDPYDLSTPGPAEGDTLTLAGAKTRTVSSSPERVCAYKVKLDQSQALNAFADGKQIIITKGMMRFVRDENELALVVAHELAHNLMGHVNAKAGNIAAGVLLGGIFDVLAAAGGVNTGGAFMKAGANAGGQAYSQEFEAEADYIGTYLLARSGYSIDEVPDFWRRMAAQNPTRIDFARTHPTTAERAVRIEATIREIQNKIARRVALIPNLKGEEKLEIDRAREAEVLRAAASARDPNPPSPVSTVSTTPAGSTADVPPAAPTVTEAIATTEVSTAAVASTLQRTAMLAPDTAPRVMSRRPADAISTVNLAEVLDLQRRTATAAKLREFPSPDAGVLAEVDEGSSVVITDLEPKGWAHVRGDDGRLGWIEGASLRGGAGEIQYAIGRDHLKRLEVERDYVTAKTWLTLAAEGGNESAHATLADLYYEGLNEPRDYERAFEHYKRAAEGGMPTAQVKLGRIYERGEGVSKNFSAASRWYRQAARSGDSAGQYHLGLLYYSGKGVKRDLVQAYIWLSLAERRDYPGAARQRDNVAIEMPTEQRKIAEEGMKLTEKAIREGRGS